MSIKLFKAQEAKEMPFELWTEKRKLNYTSNYEHGRFIKNGNIVAFTLIWKGKITESGEMAWINIPLAMGNMPLLTTAICVGEVTGCLEYSDSGLTANILPDGRICLYRENGNTANYWKRNTSGEYDQYLKLSGTYII